MNFHFHQQDARIAISAQPSQACIAGLCNCAEWGVYLIFISSLFVRPRNFLYVYWPFEKTLFSSFAHLLPIVFSIFLSLIFKVLKKITPDTRPLLFVDVRNAFLPFCHPYVHSVNDVFRLTYVPHLLWSIFIKV